MNILIKKPLMFLAVLLYLALTIKSGDCVDFTVKPDTISALSREDVKFQCTASDLNALTIHSIRLQRLNKGVIATVYPIKDVVTPRTSTLSVSKVEGFIDTNVPDHSYLTVYLNKPTHEEADYYRCIVHYLTQNETNDNVIVMARLQFQDIDLLGLLTTVNNLKITINQNAADIVSKNQFITVLRQSVNILEKQGKDKDADIDGLKKIVNELRVKNQELGEQLDKKDKATNSRLTKDENEEKDWRKKLTITLKEIDNIKTTVDKNKKETKGDIKEVEHKHKEDIKNIKDLIASKNKKEDTNGCLGADWTPVNTTCVKAFNDVKTWKDANVACEENGAYLVEILNSNQNDAVKGLLKEGTQAWIGASRTGKENGYYRFTKSQQDPDDDYSAWGNSNEPESSERGDDAVVIDAKGGWFSKPMTTTKMPFVCQTLRKEE